MFTVVIPLYNKEKYIKRALDSVFNQSFTDFEVLVINDGSTDKSLEVISQYKDPRLKILSQKNAGVSAARNKGINNANYEYVAFIDADDAWHPDFLKFMSRLIIKYPFAGLFYSKYEFVNQYNYIDIMDKNSTDRNEMTLLKDYFDFSVNNISICASSVIVKKEVLIALGSFPQKFSRGEDLMLWTTIALKFPIAYTDFNGAFYFRDIPLSLTKTKQKISSSFSSVAEEFYEENKVSAKNQMVFKEYMAPIILSKAKYLIDNGNNKEARKVIYKYFYIRNSRKKSFLLFVLSLLPKPLKKILS